MTALRLNPYRNLFGANSIIAMSRSVVAATIGAAVNPTSDPAVMPVGTVGPVIGRPVVGGVIATVMGAAIAATIGPPIGHSRSPICHVGVGLILTDRDRHRQ